LIFYGESNNKNPVPQPRPYPLPVPEPVRVPSTVPDPVPAQPGFGVIPTPGPNGPLQAPEKNPIDVSGNRSVHLNEDLAQVGDGAVTAGVAVITIIATIASGLVPQA
jgi:hypothetical protein